MSHRRTVSSRRIDMGTPLTSPPLTPLHVLNSFTLTGTPRRSRQFWQRTTYLALLILVAISGYVLLFSQLPLSQVAVSSQDNASTLVRAGQRLSRLSSHARLAALRNKQPATSSTVTPSVSQVTLNQAQELAAVSSFIASLPQNVIPDTVDPLKPIDPQLVLDFDTQSPRAAEEIDNMVNETWSRIPVMLYSKLHSPVSREFKQMLTEMNLLPSPVIIELDQRSDEAVLTPLIHRLTSTTELPILLIGGQAAGPIAETRYLHRKGELQRMISQSGALVDGGKKKKGRKH